MSGGDCIAGRIGINSAKLVENSANETETDTFACRHLRLLCETRKCIGLAHVASV